MAKAPFKSKYALLDVEAGRAKLAKSVGAGSRIPLVIRGTISGIYGNDDGRSQEFHVDVDSVDVLKRASVRRAAKASS